MNDEYHNELVFVESSPIHGRGLFAARALAAGNEYRLTLDNNRSCVNDQHSSATRREGEHRAGQGCFCSLHTEFFGKVADNAITS